MEPFHGAQDHPTEADVPRVLKVVQVVKGKIVNLIVEDRFRVVDHGKYVCDVTGVGEPRVPVPRHPRLKSVDELRVQFELAAEKIVFDFVHSFFMRATFDCDCFKAEIK